MTKVSIIIPTYNRANYIGQTIKSALSQTYSDYEIIVVDDGSTDNTKEVIAQYNGKVRYFYQENKGPTVARNLGINKSSGEYIAFLDDDDMWLPEKLEKQVRVLDADPRIGFVCCASYVIDDKNNEMLIWKRNKELTKATFENLYERNFVYNLTVLIREGCIKEVGGLDETLLVSADYDLWLRVAKKHEFYYIDEPLTKYRLHENNLSKNYNVRLRNHIKILKKVEITKDISYLKQRIRLAKAYYEFAKLYVSRQSFYKAGICYIKSTLMYPFIGSYYWPKETANLKFSLPYRIAKVYLLAIKYIIKHLAVKNNIYRFSKKIFAKLFLIFAYLYSFRHRPGAGQKNINIGFITEEFFHKDLRGFGGFGKTVKNISEYTNLNNCFFKSKVLIPLGLPLVSAQTIKRFHNSDVILRPKCMDESTTAYFKYAQLIHRAKIDIFLSIEYYPTYEYALKASCAIPLVVWIKDPRSKNEWQKISTVPFIEQTGGKSDLAKLTRLAEEKRISIAKIIKLSRLLKRRIIFATQAMCLVERAKRTYGLENLNPHLLPNPVFLPNIQKIAYSDKPSLLFIGRLDPVKRPWIVFELAKRFPQIDFYIAGTTQTPDLMNPVISKYNDTQNLKFMGWVFDQKKDELLKNCWGMINTSIHEALPVTFLEAFAFGKCVISCQNPDNLAERYGYYTGELLGEGLDKRTLGIFSEKINELISDKTKMMQKGILAKEYAEKNHSFKNFEERLKSILSLEKII